MLSIHAVYLALCSPLCSDKQITRQRLIVWLYRDIFVRATPPKPHSAHAHKTTILQNKFHAKNLTKKSVVVIDTTKFSFLFPFQNQYFAPVHC